MQGMTSGEALGKLAQTGDIYAKLLSHERYDVGVYKPGKIDHQKPHLRDEVYIVIAGSGTFFCAGSDRPFGPGDLLFVPGGVEHRFHDYTDDFSTWVIFFGAVERL